MRTLQATNPKVSLTDFGAENWRIAGVNWLLLLEPLTSFSVSIELRIMPPLCMADCLFFSWISLCWASMRARLELEAPIDPALPSRSSSMSASRPRVAVPGREKSTNHSMYDKQLSLNLLAGKHTSRIVITSALNFGYSRLVLWGRRGGQAGHSGHIIVHIESRLVEKHDLCWRT